MRFVPLLIFCIAIFIAFSSGTSWGTFAILVPIVVNMFSETDPNMMIVAVAAVLAGAVCGDHISPISDTTIMSSSGAQSNHINHVQTQMQYAMVVVAACVPGYLIAGFTENWLLTLAASLVILTVMLLWLLQAQFSRIKKAVLSKLKALLFILPCPGGFHIRPGRFISTFHPRPAGNTTASRRGTPARPGGQNAGRKSVQGSVAPTRRGLDT